MIYNDYAITENTRYIKAKKIISCLKYFDTNLSEKEVLEIGCGSGIISHEISKIVKRMIATDVSNEALYTSLRKDSLPFHFTLSDGSYLPYRNNSFDIVICNEVIEHVSDQEKLVDEIYRVMKSEGLCYIATPNKLWPIEPHAKLPFLSYVPKSLANKYIKRFRGISEYDVKLSTYWRLKRVLSRRFEKIIDFTPIVIKYPQEYFIIYEMPKFIKNILRKMPLVILEILMPISLSWIFIGMKLRSKANEGINNDLIP